ncbi:putative PEP-binding protein [Streptomyces sp. NPDC046915]|uniref:putative PEP-binding protein n=1 Tax=Streptomyces sp. NPDC046915 TaxID=3155257 RepID=UPI0033C50488
MLGVADVEFVARIGIPRAMDGLPVTIRLVDPPLHEFLPHARNWSSAWRAPPTQSSTTANSSMPSTACNEQNPMLGLRGVRLGLSVPGLMAMQVRVTAEAVVHWLCEGGRPHAAIMIPLVGTVEELRLARTGGGARTRRSPGRDRETPCTCRSAR